MNNDDDKEETQSHVSDHEKNRIRSTRILLGSALGVSVLMFLGLLFFIGTQMKQNRSVIGSPRAAQLRVNKRPLRRQANRHRMIQNPVPNTSPTSSPLPLSGAKTN